MTTDRKATAAALAALAEKYHPPAHVLALEIWSQDREESRFVDAVALNLFSGEWHGFEAKASRADLQHDIAEENAKSTWIRSRVDFFWLVEARPDLVEFKDIPEWWGVLTLRGDKLEVRRAAQRIGGTPDRDLFLGFIKRVVAGPKGDALKAATEAAFARGLAKGTEDYDFRLERAERRAEQANKPTGESRRRCSATYRCRSCDAAYCLPLDRCPSCEVPEYPRAGQGRGACVQHWPKARGSTP